MVNNHLEAVVRPLQQIIILVHSARVQTTVLVKKKKEIEMTTRVRNYSKFKENEC